MLRESTRKIKKIDYDRRNDILYVILQNENGNSYCEEITRGIEEMKDIDTEETTGYMVYYPYRDQQERQRELNDIGLSMNLEAICH